MKIRIYREDQRLAEEWSTDAAPEKGDKIVLSSGETVIVRERYWKRGGYEVVLHTKDS